MPQYETNTKGAFGWNEALKTETQASLLFTHSPKDAEELRKAGFGTVVSFVPDGIARGNLSIDCAKQRKRKQGDIKHYCAGQTFPSKRGAAGKYIPPR
jgi:hypothetical protein